MSRLPRMPAAQGTDDQARCLAAWLDEWRIEQALGDEERESAERPAPGAEPGGDGHAVATAGAGAGRSQAGDRTGHAPPQAGQIRLMFPVAAAPAARPLYVALLEACGEAAFLAAPYSRFATAATPGELATGRKPLPLRVLCVWNARYIPAAAAAGSWLSGRLRPSERRDALIVRNRTAAGEPVPPALRDRVGPPLRHPADPRRIYVAQEEALTDAILTGPERAGRDAPIRFPVPWLADRGGSPRLALAAEGEPLYGTQAVFAVSGTPYRIRVLQDGPDHPCQAQAETRAGAPTAALDGAVVIGTRHAARLEGGKASLPAADLKAGLMVLDADGRPLPMEPVPSA